MNSKPREYPFLPQLPAKMYLSSAWYAVLDAEAKALLLDLLLNYWVSVKLPADNESLAAICRTTPETIEKSLPKLQHIFQVKNGWIVSEYLDNKRRAVDKHRAGSSKGGQAPRGEKPGENETAQHQEQQELPKAPCKAPLKAPAKQTINHEPRTTNDNAGGGSLPQEPPSTDTVNVSCPGLPGSRPEQPDDVVKRVPRPRQKQDIPGYEVKDRVEMLLSDLQLDSSESIPFEDLVRNYPSEILETKKQLTTKHWGTIRNRAAYFTKQVKTMKPVPEENPDEHPDPAPGNGGMLKPDRLEHEAMYALIRSKDEGDQEHGYKLLGKHTSKLTPLQRDAVCKYGREESADLDDMIRYAKELPQKPGVSALRA